MAALYVTEYAWTPQRGLFGMKMPPIAEQKVSYTTTTASSAFNSLTTMVRVTADADAHLEFGSSPTATAANMLLPSGHVEYFEVTPGDKVAAYDGTS